jgi:hypothetical protein
MKAWPRNDGLMSTGITAGRGRWAGAYSLLIAVCLGSGVGGCGSAQSARDTGSARGRPGAVQDSESSVRYRIPQPAVVCNAVRDSGVALSAVVPERAVDYRTSCKVELGTDPEAHPYTLRVRFSDGITLSGANAAYDRMKYLDWNPGHSPFTGRASERTDLRRIGTAAVGREYDAGYYAYFPGVVIAGVPYSQSVVVLQRGNVLLELDLLGGDRTGARAVYMKPAPPEVGMKAFDDTADELLSLITPA